MSEEGFFDLSLEEQLEKLGQESWRGILRCENRGYAILHGFGGAMKVPREHLVETAVNLLEAHENWTETP